MSANKPSIPSGTRDFGPEKMIRRNYIFDSIKNVFKKFGFLPLETPAMEKLSVLTGKYGDEGDQLIYKILNSGNFTDKITSEEFQDGYKKLTPKISERALRYDLTVPFARFVVMNRNELTFPFRRYQIQPVWRADRPQKNRYREFYQCDADVVGTDSLLCEMEIIQMITEVMAGLGITGYVIKINNRKILTAITEAIGMPGRETDFCVAIDKLDKIGETEVLKELSEKGFPNSALDAIRPILNFKGTTEEKLNFLKDFLKNAPIGIKGIEELEEVFSYVRLSGVETNKTELDLTLARGLAYYTGAIFEIKATDVQMGSISGGGRYDNLTGVFGLEGVSGVGISFGIDRIYDLMEELNLFPPAQNESTKVLIGWFEDENKKYALPLLYQLRQNSIYTEIYPDPAKVKKQMEYANKKSIPFVILIGSDEMQSGQLTFKTMESGVQEKLTIIEIIQRLKS